MCLKLIITIFVMFLLLSVEIFFTNKHLQEKGYSKLNYIESRCALLSE